MLRRWNLAGVLAVVTAALLAAPAAADTDTQKSDSEKLNDIVSQLAKLQGSLATLDAIKKDLDSLRNTTLSVQTLQRDVNEMKNALSQVQQELEALRLRAPAPPRTALYPPAGAGRVRLINTFGAPMTIVLNNSVYRLAPSDTQTLDLPAGPFTYEVLGVQGPLTRTLAAGETFTIYVYPR
jgi:hypothetical protein